MNAARNGKLETVKWLCDIKSDMKCQGDKVRVMCVCLMCCILCM